MKVLHIANDYSGSTVYKSLFSNLDKSGISQLVYTAIRNENLINKNKFDFKSNQSKIIYSNILNKYDRVNFFNKIKKINKDLEDKVDLTSVTITHAHTWYSDGAIAYHIYKKFNIPYIITIRNTDLNIFYKYFFHLAPLAKKILLNAKQIIFISNVYKSRFLKTSLFINNEDKLKSKLNILHNGLDEFWINNVSNNKKLTSNHEFNILYIGKFDKGKNVLRLINAIKIINKKTNLKCNLTLVGGSGKDEFNVLKEVKENSYIEFLGPIYDKQKLKQLYASHHLFAMPSKAETFGLVYLEAISQGLPIINTINEGIYGMYDNVGESVFYNDINSIKTAINKIKNNYDFYRFDPNLIVSNHNWLQIAENHKKLYKDSTKNENNFNNLPNI